LYLSYFSERLEWIDSDFPGSHGILAIEIQRLLVHGRSTSLAELGLLLTLLVYTLGEQLRVLVGSILGSLRASSLESEAVTLVLDSLGSDESLDLGGLGVWLRTLLLGLNLTTDDELAARNISIVPVLCLSVRHTEHRLAW
jgi:hypothetical protein